MAELLRRAQNAFANSISASSRGAYSTGQRAYSKFRTVTGAPELGTGEYPDLNAAAFLAYAVTELGVAADTANSYLSHVIKQAVERRSVPNSDSIRTNYVGGVLEGLRRANPTDQRPQRERVRIPMTYPLLLTAVSITEKLWGSMPLARNAITAALALGYGCSLRPGEYLTSKPRNRITPKTVAASRVFLWWNTQSYALSEPERFPGGPADRVTVTLTSTKNDPYGKGMPRAISRAPDGAQFCCVAAIERYARASRLAPDQPAISVGETGLSWEYIRTITRLTAIEHGIDPKRLVPHSLRHGAPTQMASSGLPEADIRQQGGWASEKGARTYMLPTLTAADRAAPAIHSDSAVPTEYLLHATGSNRHTTSHVENPPSRPQLALNGTSVWAGGSISHQSVGTHQPR